MGKLKFLLGAIIILNVTCVFAQSNMCKKNGDTTTCRNVIFKGDIYNKHVIIEGNSIINGNVDATVNIELHSSTINGNCSAAKAILVDSSTINGNCTAKSTIYLSGTKSKINGTANAPRLICYHSNANKQIRTIDVQKMISCGSCN